MVYSVYSDNPDQLIHQFTTSYFVVPMLVAIYNITILGITTAINNFLVLGVY